MDNCDYLEEFIAQTASSSAGEPVPADIEVYLRQMSVEGANAEQAQGERKPGTPALAPAPAPAPSAPPTAFSPSPQTHAENPAESSPAEKTISLQAKVDRLIWSYRYYGYMSAKVNPLGEYITPELKYLFYTIEGLGDYLAYQNHGISDSDLDTEIIGSRYMTPREMPLRELIAALRETYCSGMGLEALHIQNANMRRWVIGKLEHLATNGKWEAQQQHRFQKDLIKAEEFEKFLHSNFIGQKRFSLEGGEVLIPALRYLLEKSTQHSIKEIVLGMSHRGRLNMFTNALRKRAADTFSDFVGTYQPYVYGGSGDVKYHLGHNFDVGFSDGRSIHVSLVANPSHLEAVDAVVEGKCRGIQRRRADRHRKKVMPVLIHGDAAFSGQGIVSEVFNLSQLRGYRTGGTIHIIINNQIGFTTSSRDARSTFFASDVAKILPIPIIHVNGDDPEAVARAVHLAVLYRQKFSFDVVIDIICYRRLGHNETDEPSFTHPMMYNIIQSHKTVREIYGERLAKTGVFPETEQQKFSTQYTSVLKEELRLCKEEGYKPKVNDAFQVGAWKKFQSKYTFEPVSTCVRKDVLEEVADKLSTCPEGFSINPKLQRILEARKQAIATGKDIDWSYAEQLAFGTLLKEGYSIRLSGEDCGRGTFSQRHAVWWDIKADSPISHTPLYTLGRHDAMRRVESNSCSNDARKSSGETVTNDAGDNLKPAELGHFTVYDSPLSEFAVLGFEYGYSLAQPNILIIWEAQFGDFVNGAQVIIDQFVAAAQQKWHRSSGLVMLLPHAYEGQGPEHSSAHLERFLQLCAEDNMQVVNASTPAQYFHLLRRQMHQNYRMPLIVMTPKSLLRNKQCRSTLEEITSGSFQVIIDDADIDPTAVKRVILSSGHHYYDLLEERARRNVHDTALVRMEQFYPFPRAALHTVLARYPRTAAIVWSQEESRNRGAYHFLMEGLGGILADLGFDTLRCAARNESASPATGSFSQHVDELQAVLKIAFED